MTIPKPTKHDALDTAAAFFTLLVAPLGVAGQNIGLGLGLLVFMISLMRNHKNRRLNDAIPPSLWQFLTIWLMMIIPITSATIARGASDDALSFLAGHLLCSVIIVMGLLIRPSHIKHSFLLNVATFLVAVLAVVAVSQVIFGWKFQGSEIQSQIKRAQGFYSHPLTLAYVCLAIMPWSFSRMLAHLKDWRSLIIGIGTGITILASQSVTVITISAFTILFLMIKLLPKRQLLLASIVALGTTTIILNTPNPIESKFTMVLSGERSDRETPYADDRIAFWHAHWEMFKESPILGHGTGLTATERRPFYEKIGLGHIKRMYEGHNMFLQASVEGGLISVVALCAFFIWWFIQVKVNLTGESWYRLAMLTTPIVIALGGLTQNAIQDSEVRYMILLVCASALYLARLNHVKQYSQAH
jgi:O-antigen ligase